jgi:hypothetical protein
MFWDKVKAAVKKTVEVVEKIDSSLEKVERKCLKGKSIDEAIHYEEYSEKAADAMLHPVATVKKVKDIKKVVSTVKEKTVAISKKVNNKIIRPVVEKTKQVKDHLVVRYHVIKNVSSLILRIRNTVVKKVFLTVDAIMIRLFGAKKEIVVRKVETVESK